MTTSLGEEPDISRSLVATIKLAAAKGYINKDTNKKSTTSSSSIRKKLEAPSIKLEEKRRHRDDYGSSSSRRNRLVEAKEAEYKPEINLEYTDDSGQKLETPKEAFRYLCHKFHGKGPGKNKIDKRLRKQEANKNKVLSTDSSLATAALMIAKQKELKSPYIVLSNK